MNMPKLGIFWIVKDEIVSFAVPLDRAEHTGGFANYRHGHVHLWPLVQRRKPRLRMTAYECLPRGRVTYVLDEATFNLLVPPSLSEDSSLVSRLVERFSLLEFRVRVAADEHYGAPRRDLG